LAEHDRVAYIDLDAHQGNGVCHQFMSDARVFIFDMYNASIYPCHDLAALERIDCKEPLPPRCTGSEYLYTLRKRLPGFIQSLHQSKLVRLAIYNAGTDVVAGDQLGGLSLTADDVLRRDLFVVELLREMQIPTIIVPSGGYTQESYRMLAVTATSLLERYGDAQPRH
jgi:histone deacetylase 11